MLRRLVLENEIRKSNKHVYEIAKEIGLSECLIDDVINCRVNPSWDVAKKMSIYFNISTEKLLITTENENGYDSKFFNKKRLYSVDEFRKEIMNNQISKATIYAKIRSGDIKAIKIGKRPFIPSEVVDELLTSY